MANSVADILGRLMQKYEIGENALARATGVTQPTIHRILTGESSDPKTGSLRPIAEHFGITVAQLRGDEPLQGGLPVPGQSCSGAERELISQFRQLDEEERRVIRRAVAALAQSRASGTP